MKEVGDRLRLVGRAALVTLAAILLGLIATTARADVGADPGKQAASQRQDDQHGLVVLGLAGTTDVAWPLARAVYADPELRPRTLDEAHARVLVGEPAGDAAAAELRDLGDLRAAIRGDDGASRQLLESIALSLHVNGVIVVEPGTVGPSASRPAARVFVTSSRAYDAVRYEPDPSAPPTWGTGATTVAWTGAVTALKRGFADVPPPSPPAPPPPPVSALALHAVPASTGAPADKAKSSRAFYQSPWFWAAAGAAVFAAGAVYLATRNDSTSDNIQLQVQVPK